MKSLVSKYFIKKNPFYPFIPDEYINEIIEKYYNDTFEYDSLCKIKDYFINIIGQYFIPRYKFYKKYFL